MHNDPSAGSPTDALLRLLFPLDHIVRLSFHRIPKYSSPSNSQRSPSGGLMNQRPVQGIPS